MTWNVLLAVFIFLIIYDVWVYRYHTIEKTISLELYGKCQQYPIISFILGVIVGHILWPH